MPEKKTKDEIIRALLDTAFFRSTGATSLSHVATQLSLKKASLYNHFNSRDDLLAQTMQMCASYIDEITFIPKNTAYVAQKYSAEVVLKGIANRYFKMHEKAPLFQVYTFVESQKYFVAEAADIVKKEHQKLIDQTKIVLEALRAKKKLSLRAEQIPAAADWFCSGITDALNRYLLERKQVIMHNPATGEGELFSVPVDEQMLKTAETFVHNFIVMIS
ncbi:MAG: TetR/AcrR family transcriptional regulator [Treponema sp.]|nr:TetR/AcrR family transcriptional regulator [Treponema sp.]